MYVIFSVFNICRIDNNNANICGQTDERNNKPGFKSFLCSNTNLSSYLMRASSSLYYKLTQRQFVQITLVRRS